MRALAGLLLALWAGSAAADCASGEFEGIPYTACVVDPAGEDLRLWLRGPDGQVFGTFDRLAAHLSDEGKELAFAMNGGMYHEDRAPVGYFVEDGATLAPIVTRAGPGNFGMLPNGVFCLTADTAVIRESRAFAADPADCRYAMQSGPLLVQAGRLHPKLLPSGRSAFIRNGVGLRPDGTLVFAISDAPVTFHRFARMFRDLLGAPDALYIDGNVSRLYAPELGRRDIGLPMGPIVGVARPVDRGGDGG